MSINSILSNIDNVIWGPPLLILLTFVGVYFTFSLKAIQLTKLPRAFRYIFRNEESQTGDISPFASLATVLAATIGTGNIVGVATAITTGGPGALFWMWLIAIFGMATKYAEGFLAIKYRTYDKDGFVAGGPMYYIELGMGEKFKPLAKLFAFFGVMVALFGIGTFPQVNGISHALEDVFHIDVFISATVITALVALIILGGVTRIAKVASIIVPFMAAAYVICAAIVLIINFDKVPNALHLIITMAFNPSAAGGGVLGFTVMMAIQSGLARGIFSNESGLGSAPMAAAAANIKSPVRQGLISMTGTFLDTVIICAMTGLVIVISGAWQGDVQGAALTNLAFNQGLSSSFGSIIVTIGLVFFAFTTILGWNYYGERCVVYLTKGNTNLIKYYRLLFIIIIFSAPFLSLNTIWSLADIVNGLMAFPNLIALLCLRKIVIKETKEFFEKIKATNK